jgi:hypothetical protein
MEALSIEAVILLIGKTAVAGSSPGTLPNFGPALCFRTGQRAMGERQKLTLPDFRRTLAAS